MKTVSVSEGFAVENVFAICAALYRVYWLSALLYVCLFLCRTQSSHNRDKSHVVWKL